MDVTALHIPVLPQYVYLHYPLCRHTCSYCDFNVYTASRYQGFAELWLRGIERDLETFSRQREDQTSSLPPLSTELASLYLGGGTPSLLDARDLERLIKIFDRFYSKRTSDFEFTIECNPETLTEEKIRDFKSLGLNRVSLGLQSFQETELKRLERLSTRVHLNQSLEWISKYFENFSVDLMLAIPDQQSETMLDNISELLRWSPPHISLYLLTIADDHPWKTNSFMKKRMSSDDSARDFYLQAAEKLKENKFEHYEVSNFAREGFRSKHNSNYWDTQTSYLGLGPGAHGYFSGKRKVRYEMIRDPMTWASDSRGLGSTEILSDEQHQLEDFYLRLRTRKPVRLVKLPEVVSLLKNEGLLINTSKDEFILSDQGWVLMESLAARLLQCA